MFRKKALSPPAHKKTKLNPHYCNIYYILCVEHAGGGFRSSLTAVQFNSRHVDSRSTGCSCNPHSSEVDHHSRGADSCAGRVKNRWSAKRTKSLLWDSAEHVSGAPAVKSKSEDDYGAQRTAAGAAAAGVQPQRSILRSGTMDGVHWSNGKMAGRFVTCLKTSLKADLFTLSNQRVLMMCL